MLHAPILYPKTYALFLTVAALDVLCTWLVLSLGGREVNYLANLFLQQWDVHGLLVLKFAVCAMVLFICEFVGRRKPSTAVRLVSAAIVLNIFPVVVGASQVIGFMTAVP